MPRCQRTFERLGESAQTVSGTTPVGITTVGIPGGSPNKVWRCSFCPEAETYQPIIGGDFIEYARIAYAMCISDFGPPRDNGWRTTLWAGLRPECVREPSERAYDIYLGDGGDALQWRLQIGHEMFHRVCSQGRVFHWSHEMLACLASVRLLRRSGFETYATQTETEYARQATLLEVKQMQDTDVTLPPYPAGLYGRAFETGRALQSVVGWPALCRLARCLNRTDVPDVSRWCATLSSRERIAVLAVLGITE